MTTINRIRRRIAAAGAAGGAPSDISHGELAFNEVDGILYYGSGAKAGSDKANAALKVGGAGTFVALEGDQTITGNKTFSGIVYVLTPPTDDSSLRAVNTTWVQAKIFDGGNF